MKKKHGVLISDVSFYVEFTKDSLSGEFTAARAVATKATSEHRREQSIKTRLILEALESLEVNHEEEAASQIAPVSDVKENLPPEVVRVKRFAALFNKSSHQPVAVASTAIIEVAVAPKPKEDPLIAMLPKMSVASLIRAMAAAPDGRSI